MEIYVVQPGDTLEKIAAQFHVSASFIIADNGILDPNNLVIGQTLVIRFPSKTYTVQPGDTLYSLAGQLGVSIRQLYRNNPILTGHNTIYPGQTLIVSYQAPAFNRFLSVNGYAYPYIETDLFESTLPFLSEVTPFTYGIQADGTLVMLQDRHLLELAAASGTAAIMHLSTLTQNGTFSSELAQTILHNDSLQETLIDCLQDVVLEKGYAGLDVDFEYLPASSAELYAQFIQRLRNRLSPFGLPVMVALAPKTNDQQSGLLYEGHDYALLGRAADHLLLMTYEWGYTYGPPMAVAPLPNVRKVLEYAVSRISPQKLWLGIPTYGYDWTLPFVSGQSRAVSISPQKAISLAQRSGTSILYDTTAQSPYFFYHTADGIEHEVWFEDARSIYEKLSLILEFGLSGAGYWNLMRSFPQNWVLLDSLFHLQA